MSPWSPARAAAFLVLLAVTVPSSSAQSEPPRVPPSATSGASGEARSGEILIKLRSLQDAEDLARPGDLTSARSPGLSAVLRRHGIAEGHRLFPDLPYRRLDRVVRVVSERVRRDPSRLREVLESLRARPEVEYAEPNLTLQAYNDPYLSSSGAWGQSFADLWGLHKIQAPQAWPASTGAGIVVAVLDTGLYFEHPELAANVWVNPGENGLDPQGADKRTNGVDDDANGYVDDWRGWDFIGPGWGSDNDPHDEHGHGTHVAGTIAAVGGNAYGIAGVAPSAKVMAVRVLDAYGSGPLDRIASGVIYAADRGARVLNLSLGTTSPDAAPQTLRDAIAWAHDVKGAVVVAAAGNSATDVGTEWLGYFPAAFRDVVTVAATNSADLPASFSNFGAAIDMTAPGGGDTDPTGTIPQPARSVLSLLSVPAYSGMTGNGQLLVGDGFLRQSGTSMAAPHVAGAAALILAQHPEYGPEQVRQALRRGADDVAAAGYDLQTGHGRLNAAEPLARPSAPLASRLVGPTSPRSAIETVPIVGTVGGAGPNVWTLEYGAGASPASWSPVASGTTSIVEGTLAGWNLGSVPDGAYTLRLTVRDGAGEAFEDRMPFTVDSVSITTPSSTSTTPYRGGDPVQLTGSVETADFQSFYVRVVGARTGQLANPAVTLAGGGLSRIHEGPLAVWDTTGVAADHYQVCLVVVAVGGATKEECVATLVDPSLHPGWPQSIGGGGLWWSPTNHVTVADVDGDGAKELLVGYGYEVRVLRHDGAAAPGWPRSAYGTVLSSPAVGDVTGDGQPEVVAADGSGYVHVWSGNGDPLAGWPRQLLTGLGAIALVDLDGDGVREILAVDSGYSTAPGTVTAVKGDGTPLPGWPRSFGLQLAPPAVGDVDGDGTPEIVLATKTTPTAVHVLRADGATVAGWPLTLDPAEPQYQWTDSHPALADFDGDGAAEIVMGTKTGKAFVLRGSGAAFPGWPVDVGSAMTFNSPALGDINGDGVPEIVMGGRDSWLTNRLYAWGTSGTPLAGWPRMLDFWPSGRFFFGFGAPVLADLNGDGRADVVVSSDADYLAPFALQAFDWTGASLAGYPKPTLDIGADPANAPAVADLDGDGQLELAWIDTGARLYVWDLPAPAAAVAPWPMVRRDAQHTGRLPVSLYRLTLTILGVQTGRGSVSGSPSGSCNNLDGVASRTCALAYGVDTVVTLTATPASDSLFLGWGGACSGTATTCQVSMTGAQSVTASFRALNLPPVANPGGPYSGPKNQPIQLDGSASSDPEGSPLSYSWSFGDGTTGSGVTPTHTYTRGGTYTVTLTVSDGAKTGSASTTVTVIDTVPPAAVTDLRVTSVNNRSVALAWTATGDDGSVGTAAQYDLRYSTAPIDETNFASARRDTSIMAPRVAGSADGSTVDSLLPPTTYYFALKVIDAAGNASPISNVVSGAPIGLTLLYDDFESGLSGWTLTGNPQLWEWNDSVSYSPTHSLRYRTISGVSATHTMVSGPINIVGARNPHLSFQLASHECPEGSLSLSVQPSWDGGSTWGPSWAIWGSGPLFSRYEVNLSGYNEHTVLLRFIFSPCYTTAGAGRYIDDVLVTADSIGPIAKPGGPYAALKRQGIAFDGSASLSPTGAPLTYSWTFGDGTTATGPQPVHAYQSAGTFTVTLTVSDGTASASATTTATVTNRAPIAVVGGPYTGTESGAAVSLDGTGSYDPDGDSLTYNWSFGDGLSGTGATPTHVFARGGSLTVTLTVNDGTASSAPSSTTATISAVPPSPVVDLAAAATGSRSVRLNWTATGDDGSAGTASTYDVRYSTSPIDATSFATATQATGEPLPRVAGSAETMTVSSLSPDTLYYFTLRVADDSSAWSPISNVPAVRTYREQTAFSDDMESGLGNWTIAGSDGIGGPALWHLGTHRYSSPSGALYYGLEPGHTYNTGARNFGSATSRSISLVGVQTPRLSFRHYLQKEGSSSYDIARLLISTNGTTFTQLGSYSTTGSMTLVDLDLAAYQNMTIWIRFDFDTVDAVSNVFEGWVIDDVRVAGAQPNRAPVASAGADRTINEGTTATLDGSASNDPDGHPLTFEWRDASGNVIASTASVTVSPALGAHDFTLTVSDGVLSATDTVRITVVNERPLALDLASLENGAGTVTTDVPSPNCAIAAGSPPVSCVLTFPVGTVVTLTASPSPDSVFEGWVGACTGTAPTCQVTMTDDVVVGASFRGPQMLTLDVAGLENGAGLVSTDPPTPGCGNAPGSPPAQCTFGFRVGTVVTLTASPSPDSVFEGWVGACTGTAPTCVVTMTDELVVGASFRGPQMLTLDVAGLENGAGLVSTDPPTPGCGNAPGSPPAQCTFGFRVGTVVTLTASPSPDSVFEGWMGACTGTAPTCVVTMTDELVVGASFRGPQMLTLDVAGLENGAGLVSTDPPTPGCGNAPGSPPAQCTFGFRVGTMVTLTASPSPDSAFEGWMGACTGTAATCQVTMTDELVVGTAFRGPQMLTLVVGGEGSGEVEAAPPSSICQNQPGSQALCVYPLRPGTATRLTARPAADSLFQGWTGACAGQGPQCDLMVTDDISTTATFILRNHPPTANAGGPYAGVRNQEIAFNGSGSSDPDGDALTYAWAFGDGTTGAGVSPSHTYASMGTFTVTLTVNDGTVTSAPATATVTISNQAPIANAGGPYSAVRNQEIAFSGSGSSDPDGDALTYAWAFGDGTTGTGVSPSHAYTSMGTFTVTLTVNDGTVSSAPATATVTISNQAPVANAGGPYLAVRNQPIAFNGSASSDPDGDALTYAWDFGDGTTGTGVSPSHAYASVGTFTVTLTVNDGTVTSAPATATVTISNQTPIANAGGPYSAVRNQEIAFSGSGSSDPDGDALTYAWAFGDGTTGTGASPSHAYASMGTFTVTLTVNDGTVTSAPATATVTISNQTPIANAGGPYSAVRNQPITFNGSASSDPDGDALTYAWDFGDGTTGTGASPSHAYTSLGSFTVTLTVNDGTTTSAPATATVTISNQTPIANAGGPYSAVRNQPIAFNGSASSDPDGDALTYAWDFGDGTTGTGASPSHAYTSLGSFTVTLTVNDGTTTSAPATATVTISNQAPTANAGGPYSGTRVQAITFNGSGSSDPDGDALTYAWNFGDGTTGTGASPSHTYSQLGTFTVTLTVNDGTTTSAPAATSVEITNVAPSVVLTSPAAGSVFTVPASVALNAAANDPDGSLARVEFYAGTTKIGEDTTAPYSIVWSGAPAGAYALSARAIDDSGASVASAPVAVTLNAPPSVALTGPADGAQFAAPASITLTASAADGDGSVMQVEFFQGGTSLGVATTSPYSVSWNDVGPGVYTLTARATDNHGASMVSAPVTVKVTAALTPTADAYVRGGSSNANQNFGATTTLTVQQGNSGGNQRWSYLKFDLASVPSVTSAKLRLFGALSATTGTTVQTAVYPVSSTTWTEGGITWNNKPASGTTALATVTMVNSSTMQRWYEWDVTAYLQQEKAAGRNVVTLVLKNLANSSPFDRFNSKEAAASAPSLFVVP